MVLSSVCQAVQVRVRVGECRDGQGVRAKPHVLLDWDRSTKRLIRERPPPSLPTPSLAETRTLSNSTR